jgi:putative oxidoreductase
MMNVAVAGHGRGGLWNHNGGYELPLLYGAVAAGLAIAGPGAYALDAALGLPGGAVYGVSATGLGLLAGGLAAASRRPTTQAAGAA